MRQSQRRPKMYKDKGKREVRMKQGMEVKTEKTDEDSVIDNIENSDAV